MLELILKCGVLVWGYAMWYMLGSFFNKPFGALIILFIFGIFMVAKEMAIKAIM